MHTRNSQPILWARPRQFAPPFTPTSWEPEDEEKDPLPLITSELLNEWPGGETRFLVYGSGTALGARGPVEEVEALRSLEEPSNPGSTWTAALVGNQRFMIAEALDTGPLALRVVAARSTASLEAFDAAIRRWMFLSIPAVTLLAVLVRILTRATIDETNCADGEYYFHDQAGRAANPAACPRPSRRGRSPSRSVQWFARASR